MRYSNFYMISQPNLIVKENNLQLKIAKHRTQVPRDTTWPLTGGIPCQLHDAEDYQVERVYIAGYQDGSIRIWDATYPSFSRIFSFEPEVCISCYVFLQVPIILYSADKLFCLC